VPPTFAHIPLTRLPLHRLDWLTTCASTTIPPLLYPPTLLRSHYRICDLDLTGHGRDGDGAGRAVVPLVVVFVELPVILPAGLPVPMDYLLYSVVPFDFGGVFGPRNICYTLPCAIPTTDIPLITNCRPLPQITTAVDPTVPGGMWINGDG